MPIQDRSQRANKAGQARGARHQGAVRIPRQGPEQVRSPVTYRFLPPLAAVFVAYRATRMPIVGMGGVSTGRDALEFVAAGAQEIALGTILFSDPDAPSRVRSELAAELAALGVADADEIRGVAHEGGLARVATVARG